MCYLHTTAQTFKAGALASDDAPALFLSGNPPFRDSWLSRISGLVGFRGRPGSVIRTDRRQLNLMLELLDAFATAHEVSEA